MYVENLLTCVNSYFMSMAKFCRYEYEKILWWHAFFVFFGIDHGTLIMEGFCWAWDFGYGNIFVGYVLLDHGKFLWLWFWTCINFFCDFGHEGIFLIVILVWIWEKLCMVMGNFFWLCIYMKKKIFGCDFGHGKFFVVIVMLVQTLFCRTSRVEATFKCWKAYGRYCL